MSEPYEEIVEGETLLRCPPGKRHEQICSRLHDLVASSLAGARTSRLLEPRSVVQLSAGTLIRPDLCVRDPRNGTLQLAVEIISSEDHRPDTVTKKGLYEEMNIHRLWMVDPRYDNVEVYHATPYGLKLMGILAGKDTLTDEALPDLRIPIADLFRE